MGAALRLVAVVLEGPVAVCCHAQACRPGVPATVRRPFSHAKQGWDPYSPAAEANARLARELAEEEEEAHASAAEL